MPQHHRATDRTTELVAKPEARHSKGKPLGLTFILCNKSLSIAPEYTEVLCTRKSYVLSNKPIHIYMQALYVEVVCSFQHKASLICNR